MQICLTDIFDQLIDFERSFSYILTAFKNYHFQTLFGLLPYAQKPKTISFM